MAQYLTKLRGDKFPQVVELQRVTYRHFTEPTGNIGGFQIVRSTGKIDKNSIELWTNHTHLVVSPTRESVHAKIRKLREQEAAQLAEIAEQMKALHAKKLEILQAAWNRGNVVTVKELLERIDE